MPQFTPACDGKEEEFGFTTEIVSTDETGERVMSLLAPDECHSCPLAKECSQEALRILNNGNLDGILELQFIGKLQ